MRSQRFYLALLPLLLLFSSCTTPPVDSETSGYEPITGQIELDQSIFLSSDLSVEILLLDVSTPGEEPLQLSKQIIKNPKRTPLNFILRFDQEDIQSFSTYIVRSFVYQGERLIFRSEADSKVLTLGNPDTIRIFMEEVF